MVCGISTVSSLEIQAHSNIPWINPITQELNLLYNEIQGRLWINEHRPKQVMCCGVGMLFGRQACSARSLRRACD